MITKITPCTNTFNGKINGKIIKKGVGEAEIAISRKDLGKFPFLNVPAQLKNKILITNQDLIEMRKRRNPFNLETFGI
jgi:hypothetical protein